MQLASILSVDAVLPRMVVRDKKQVFKKLAPLAANLTGLPEGEVYATLMQREKLGCTGMGSGVCVPHGRFERLNRSYALCATLATPVLFGAEDGMPVDIVFLLLTPASANTDHLKALATVSRLLRDKSLCAALRAANDPAELFALLIAVREEE